MQDTAANTHDDKKSACPRQQRNHQLRLHRLSVSEGIGLIVGLVVSLVAGLAFSFVGQKLCVVDRRVHGWCGR